ncbi:MAG: transposon-encoded TnpW family protein [Oscillibacter sp.]|nr:transposon-encoded TnpW family protein [Oscillibacter sp.]
MHSNTAYLTRRIGSTTYKIKVHFGDSGTMEEKILHMIREESLDKSSECGIIRMPQMSRQSGRSLT